MAKHRSRTKSGRFTKGGSSKAMVRYRTKHITKYRTRHAATRPRRRRSGKHSGALSLTKLGIAAVGIGWLTSAQSSPAVKVRDFFATTIPGGKTFGPAAMLGGTALVIDRFVYKSPWLRAAGIVGVVAAALKLGEQNTGFKFLGDVSGDHGEDEFVADID